MKDMFKKNIEVGDYIIYIQSFASKHLEKAIVVENEETFIKIEYLGMSTYPFPQYCKQKGKKSKLTITKKRVVIISAEENDNTIIDVYRDEKNRFDKVIKKVKKELMVTIKRETDLLKDNKELQAEVDKIHQRFDILDL